MHVLCVNKLFLPLANLPIVSLICTPSDTKLEGAEEKINPHPLYYCAVLSHFKSGLTLCNPRDCSLPDCTLHSEGLFLPTSLINILFLTALLNGCCSWAAQHRFPALCGGGDVNYAERWRAARQPLWWTVSFKYGPLPAVLQLQGSPVGLGIRPTWGLAEMTDSARNESQLIFQYPKLGTEWTNMQ